MTDAETRAVLTQDGEVRITFDEAGRNTIAGSPAAIRALDRALLTQVNRYGIGVTLDSLQPDDLKFVAGQGSGLVLADPPMLDEVDPPPMPSEADDEDEFDAQAEFDAVLLRAIRDSADERGMTMTPDTLDPDRFAGFCMGGPDKGIFIIPPAEIAFEPPAQEQEIAPTFDSAALQANFDVLAQEAADAVRLIQALQCIRDELDR